MKYEMKVTATRKLSDLIIGAFIMMFVFWAAASCSPFLTAIIMTFVAMRAALETDQLQLRSDILRMATSKIDHKYGLKGARFEQSVEAVIDVEEMKRNSFAPDANENKPMHGSDAATE